MSQKEKILKHMQAEGSMTDAIARADYGIHSLSSRVSELKRDGHRIESELRTTPGGTRYAAYIYKGWEA